MNKSFSLGALIMVILVGSMTAMTLGYLLNAAMGGLQDVIWFFPMTAFAPLLLMIVVSWCFKIYRVLTRGGTPE